MVPQEDEAKYREAGVDDFISVKANCYEIIRELQRAKGMKITEGLKKRFRRTQQRNRRKFKVKHLDYTK